MIIVSQKNKLINFDNVEEIKIEDLSLENYQRNCFGVLGYTVSNKKKELGIYETEERAKEVLKEILEAYKNCNYYSLSQMGKGFVINDYYEMPKE